MKKLAAIFSVLVLFASTAQAQLNSEIPQVEVKQGRLQGINDSGVRLFKGIPFAQPPTGKLRWKPPQPPSKWQGMRQADRFGPRCMQRRIFDDMVFRSDGMSEDCLYLNVWTPAKSADAELPVLVYFYGGGFIAGDGSEPRYQGESMARNKGIVAITVNYRLGVFGFLAHPGLTAESPHNASGNYGLLDQAQALKWVKDNVAAFGGDPNKITIAGESAGSISVSALMASPLSRDLFRGAIGESGSLLGSLSAEPLDQGEQTGKKFASHVGAQSLAELRAMPAESLLAATADRNVPRFPITVDGYFFPKAPSKIYEQGEQSQVPLLVGWNSEEMNYRALLGQQEPSPENYKKVVQKLYDEHAEQILEYYPGTTTQQVIQSATALASDRFIAFSTWKWSYLQSKTSAQPVYRYYYSHPRPAKADADSGVTLPPPHGAVHSAEIEYAMGNLPTNEVYAWTAKDYKVSNIMQKYFARFIKTGDPNGLGVPTWMPLAEGETPHFMQIDVNTRLRPVQHRERHQFLDTISSN